MDLTPEGHQHPTATRFFRGNQQPICVAIFIRIGSPNRDVDGDCWQDCADGTFRDVSSTVWQCDD